MPQVHDLPAQYWLRSTEETDIEIDEAQQLASTLAEDQDEDPQTSEDEIAWRYAVTGMDPSVWEEVDEDTSPELVGAKHLPGRHDQSTHGRGGGSGAVLTAAERKLPTSSSHKHKTESEAYAAAGPTKQTLDSVMNEGKGVEKDIGAKAVSVSSKETLNAALKEEGHVVLTAPIKGKERATEKATAKYGGDWSRMNDLARGTIAVDKAEDIPKTMKSLRKHLADNDMEIVAAEDRITNPTKAGYRDLQVLVHDKKTGLNAEIQINTKAMIRYKQGEGHKLYEKWRSIQAAGQKEGRPPTDGEANQMAALERQMRDGYEKAWKGE